MTDDARKDDATDAALIKRLHDALQASATSEFRREMIGRAAARLSALLDERDTKHPLDEGWNRAEEAQRDRAAAVSQWKAELVKRIAAEDRERALRELLAMTQDWLRMICVDFPTVHKLRAKITAALSEPPR